MITVEVFFEEAGLDQKTELERVCFLAYYHLRADGLQAFNTSLASIWLQDLNLSLPNITRLNEHLAKCPDTVRDPAGGFRLSRKFIAVCDSKFSMLSNKSQQVMDLGTLLPASLHSGTPGYIQSLARQINASYEHNIFDGCAVLMRRLEEVLLILSYEHLGIGHEVKGKDGLYFMLEAVVKNAIGNTTLNLSRNSRRTVETIRELGNFSAHKITYICKREYIKERINEYRALVDELLHKSGLKV